MSDNILLEWIKKISILILKYYTFSFLQLEALDKDICLLVDEKDNFVGTATKRECHKVGEDGKILLHRAFSVFLFNKRGDMLLQRRASQKVITFFILLVKLANQAPLFLL